MGHKIGSLDLLSTEREKVKPPVIYPGQEISKAILVRMEIVDL